MSDVLPPPSTSIPAVEDNRGHTMDFTPVWRKWFIDLADILNRSGGTEGSISAVTNVTGREPIVITGNLKNNNIEVSVTEFTSNKAGVVPKSNGGTANFLRADGAWAQPGAGINATVALAKLTPAGVNGSMTFVGGRLTAYTPPT